MTKKNETTEVKVVKIGAIKPNPSNPRVIKDDKFKKLVKSIQEFPEMLNIRPIVINDDNIILGGNMRLKACVEAGLKEVPTINISYLPEEKQREFIIKDNIGYGEWDWDLLANDFEMEILEDWGLDTIKHDWEALDYIDEEVATPKLKKENELVIVIAEEWMDKRGEIEDEVKKFLSERYSGCDIK